MANAPTLIAYPSGELRITGVMTVPPGDGPFPVLLLNHGDIPAERYTSGDDLHQGEADTEVKPQWAVQVRDALQCAGKPVEYFSYPGKGHNVRGVWQVIAERTTAFFESHVRHA